MALLVRKLDTAKWIPSDSFEWLAPDDIEADPIGDLATTDNGLSVYLVENEELTKRVVAAIAAKASASKNQALGYVIIDKALLDEWGFKLDDSEKGTTQDLEVNDWHRNIIELSANRIIHLVKAMKDMDPHPVFPNELVETLKNSVQEGYLKLNDISDKATRSEIQVQLGN